MPCACHFHTTRRDVLRGLGAGALAAGTGSLPVWAARHEDGTFAATLTRLFDRAGGAGLGRIAAFAIGPAALPWETRPMEVAEGQAVTLLLSGRWYMARAADLWLEPGFVTMARVGDGAMVNPMLNAATFVADRAGSLTLARSAGELGPEGALMVPAETYAAGDGRVEGVAIVWDTDPVEGLRRLREQGDLDGTVGLALERLLVPEVTPAGWRNFYHFGESGVFRHEGDEMACRTRKTVSILTRAIDLPLADGVRLDWDWWVDELPSLVAEDQLASHDYLSIGVQFDDGQDLTYLWSAELPVGHAFRCPIPGWDAVETHLVQRSGLDDTGRWLSESRDVSADYRTHIGGPARRAVSLWLLGVSVFQRREGACRYRNVAVTAGAGPGVAVL